MKSDPGVPTVSPLSPWREILILYRREMRAALRERTILFNSILMPIFLYPFILWAAFTGIAFVQGQTEGFVSRVRVHNWPEGHAGMRSAFERERQVQLVKETISPDEAVERVKSGRLDAFVEFLPVAAGDGLKPPNFEVRITSNESRERSGSAQRRVSGLIHQYRQKWLQREALARGIPPAGWQGFQINTVNVASRKQVGSFVLALMLPLLFSVMVALGCFFPAVDSTAGERERHTWETLMSTAASRVSIVTSKYLYVATLGGLAGVLNVTAMLVTIKPIFAPLVQKTGEGIAFSVPLTAVPILLLAALLLAAFIAAGMMIFAAFARTFKEGQAMITPFYIVVILPILFLQVPGLTFTVPLAFIPVVNIVMMVRAAISGSFPLLQIVLTVAASLGVIVLCLRLAAWIMQFEDVMLGSYNGSLFRFVRQRLLSSGSKQDISKNRL